MRDGGEEAEGIFILSCWDFICIDLHVNAFQLTSLIVISYSSYLFFGTNSIQICDSNYIQNFKWKDPQMEVQSERSTET